MNFIPHTPVEKQALLNEMGYSTIQDLFQDIPSHLILNHPLEISKGLSELELMETMASIAKKNKPSQPLFLGGGSYRHYIPATVPAIVERSEFYTAYTPYQPEISQGTLQAIFEYQSMICQLSGMDISNASMYDGATSLAEAMLMACKIQNKSAVLVSKAIQPSYREVLNTYARVNGISITEMNLKNGCTDPDELIKLHSPSIAAVLIQTPNFLGCLEDLSAIRKITDSALLITATTEVLSWGLLKPFGQFGVDIVTAEGQSFGNPMNFGGPGLGVFAVKKDLMRQMPGRIIGQTVDTDGNRGFVLTLCAREQHIRREKATSNICSNEGLCALSAAVYLATVGSQLKPLAELNHRLAVYAFEKLTQLPGIDPVFSTPFFNEFVIKISPDQNYKLAEMGVELGIDLGKFYSEYQGCQLVCCTELMSQTMIDSIVQQLA